MDLSILKTTLSRFFKREVAEAAETPELYLRLTTKCMEQVDRMTMVSTALKFNREQCKYLTDKLKKAERSAHSFLELINSWYSPVASPEGMTRSLEIFKLLFAMGKEVESFIEGCCKVAWIQSAISLTKVSEHISSIGFNLEICTKVFAKRKIIGAIPSLTLTEVASVRKVEAEIAKEKANLDKLRLKKDLNALIELSQPSSVEWQLATFLLERLESPRQHPGPNLKGLNQFSYPEILGRGLKQQEILGKGASGTVHKAMWMGAEVAKKTFYGPSVPDFEQEVSTLEGLRHPNIISLLWYMRDERKCYIIMELMDDDLYSLMKKRLEELGIGDPPFSISEAVYIMLQVAEGMLFLHGEQIVHRDLKSHNILVKCMKARFGVKYLQVKVADFGLSRTKEKSMTYTNQTQNQGTTRWMAPEMIELVNDDGQVELPEGEVALIQKFPFKVDVYSFAMVCYEILTGEVPFPSLNFKEVKKKVLLGDRPQLPDQCPDRLRNLIEACWSSEPSKRPRFGDICAELRHLKCAHYMTSAWARASRCFSFDEIIRMTNKFSMDNILSWGALFMVYKGVMVDTGEVVAVKRIFENKIRCLDKFDTQMELLSGLHHKNLVASVGFCYAEDETILVLEYMPNDSLGKWLSEDAWRVHLTWLIRRNICLGVANGIHYLHSLAQPRIIHRHIRPSNILLDQTLEPKIGCFHLALLDSDDEIEIRSPQQCAASLEPLSEKVDVYSFGFLLLEIMSGRRRIDPKFLENQIDLGERARELLSEGRIKELIDPALDLQPHEEIQAVRILKVALLCIHTEVETRPDMTVVVSLLQGNLDVGISRLGLERDKERFGMLMDERQVSFGSPTGDFEVDRPSSRWKLDHFAEAEEQPAVKSSTEEGESSDANFDGHIFDEPLERKVLIGLQYLSSSSYPKVLVGFAHLIECASLPGGSLAVFNAEYVLAPPASPAPPAPPIVIKAIPTVIKLAKSQDPQYSKLAVTLMEALTSDRGGGPDSKIILEVADALDVLISFVKEESLSIIRLLAAETVANILVHRQVRKAVLSGYDGFIPALVALSNVDAASQSIKHLTRADAVCLKALQRLTKCSEEGDKSQMIVAAVIKLLRRGLRYQPELEILVKDSLVALENQILAMDHVTSTNEVCMVVWKDMSELMVTEGFVFHTSVPGRMAIISIMTKLCGLYKEDISKYLFLYLLKTMKGTRSEILELSQRPPQEGVVVQQLKKLTKLLFCCLRLFCFCVTHGKNTAIAVLSENVEERKSLEEMMDEGDLDFGSLLEVLSVLDQINLQSTQGTPVRGIEILVRVSKSEDQACRQHVASTFRMLVAEKLFLTELKEAGGIDALVALLKDPNPKCHRDALVALHALPPSMIPVAQLPLQTIFDSFSEKWPPEERNAAIGLLDWVVKDEAVCADMLVKTKGALKATLNLLEKAPDSPGSQMIAFVLLEMAKEDQSVRLRISEPGLRGLDILVKYVTDHVKDESRNKIKLLLIATLVLFCGSGETYQEAVINADGHVFLLTSLQEKILKADAAQGLLHLISNTRTSEKVLEAGFVTTAMHSIDVRFPCTDIALGLARISSTPEGLNQIYSDPFSVSALLILLEHCPDPTGKDAAASVIARLYPRLNRTEVDVARQTKIAEACDLFFTYLDPLDISHFKAYFEALAVIAAEAKGRKMIHEYRGHLLLIRHLSVPKTDLQCLVLKILAEMSSDVSENGVETRAAKMIRSAFMEERISDELFKLFNSEEFNRRTESMMNALILIRNLSLAGSNACEQLAEQGAVALLLDVLKRHEGSMSVVPELAVEALEKLVDYPKGKQVFLKGGGMKSVVAVLKLEAYGRTRDSKFFSTTILIAVAKDPQTRKAACAAIFDCDILSALNRIIFKDERGWIRLEAAVLMKLLAMYGPTSRVCRAMKSECCLDALIHLRTVQHCGDMANDVLKFVGVKSRDCKRYIDGRLSQVDA